MNWQSGQSVAPFASVIDVFGDQSFFALHTPGHSMGHSAFLLHTEQGMILLTGDASHTRYGFEHNIEPGWTDDADLAAQSLHQLRLLAEMMPAMKVIFGHAL